MFPAPLESISLQIQLILVALFLDKQMRGVCKICTTVIQ